jgi:capsular exopolysaccharide synthesis family protein
MLGEGKSTVNAFLGMAAARLCGMKTILIDCDLRRPVVHRQFGLERRIGLAEIMAEGFSFQEAIKKTGANKLDVITAGSLGESASTALDIEVIGALINDLKFYYDLILLDAPPVLPVSEPMLLASKVDGILMVVKAGATNRRLTQRAVEILSGNKDRILGVVLNNLNASLPYYNDYRHYAYRYKADHQGRSGKKQAGGTIPTAPKKSAGSPKDQPRGTENASRK